jgi:molecular chaperone GrpE
MSTLRPDPKNPDPGEPEDRDLAEVAEAEVAARVAPCSEEAPEAALEAALSEVARIKDQLLRTAADFDNFRKRSRREIDDAVRQGKEAAVRELLPVFDNLERAILHAGQATDVKAVADGVSMVLRQFLEAAGRLGIRRIEAVGLPFDPMRHEAIQQMETTEHPAGTIVTEVQPGYTIGDKLLRASMVIVAKPPADPASEPS